VLEPPKPRPGGVFGPLQILICHPNRFGTRPFLPFVSPLPSDFAPAPGRWSLNFPAPYKPCKNTACWAPRNDKEFCMSLDPVGGLRPDRTRTTPAKIFCSVEPTVRPLPPTEDSFQPRKRIRGRGCVSALVPRGSPAWRWLYRMALSMTVPPHSTGATGFLSVPPPPFFLPNPLARYTGRLGAPFTVLCAAKVCLGDMIGCAIPRASFDGTIVPLKSIAGSHCSALLSSCAR